MLLWGLEPECIPVVGMRVSLMGAWMNGIILVLGLLGQSVTCQFELREREELMSTVSTLFDGKLNIHISFFISSFFTDKNIEFCVSLVGFQNIMDPVYVFKYWKLLFENICENMCGVKKCIKICVMLFKNWNDSLKTQTKHPYVLYLILFPFWVLKC